MANKIKVLKDVKVNFRKDSARDLYYQRIAKYHGKTLEAFVKDCEANPPSTPKRGKLKGKAEPVAGWVSWFQRHGYVEISES